MNNLSGSLSFHGDVSGQMGANLIPSVEANPSGTATEILTSIRVGDIIYSIPSGGGGGGGTNNYNSLLNKPKINNVILSGELSLSDLGIYNPVTMTGATSSADGAAGYAPKPLVADKDKFLKGDGTWADPSSGSNYSETILWEGSGYTESVWNLSESYKNFDAVEVICRGGGNDNFITSNIFSINTLDYAQSNSNFRCGLTTDGWFCWFYVRSNTQFERADTGSLYVNKIIGINY